MPGSIRIAPLDCSTPYDLAVPPLPASASCLAHFLESFKLQWLSPWPLLDLSNTDCAEMMSIGWSSLLCATSRYLTEGRSLHRADYNVLRCSVTILTCWAIPPMASTVTEPAAISVRPASTTCSSQQSCNPAQSKSGGRLYPPCEQAAHTALLAAASP